MNIADIMCFLRKLGEENYSGLSEQERFDKIYSQQASQEVFEYIKSQFDNLTIEIGNSYGENIIELMQQGSLCNWCWQTTETAILFLEDTAYIQRGNLNLEVGKRCFHSWIIFRYKGVEYVFDPCLTIICKKDIYDKIFGVEVVGEVTAKQVKDYFINYITNPPKKNLTLEEQMLEEKAYKMLVSIVGEKVLERSKGEIVVHDKEDVNAPMFRNGVGYKVEIGNGKIKKLVAHYYSNC